MDKAWASARSWINLRTILEAPVSRSYTNYVGNWLLLWADTFRQIGAFGLITLGVMITQFNRAPAVIRPLIRTQIARSGLRLLPMVAFISCALGFVVIGQTVALLNRVGAQNLVGTVMVIVVVRALGPLVTALVVLLRIGTANVIELGTARALGEIEALEALAIDPIHYLVVPRVIGMAVAAFTLTAYLVLGAIFSGYLFAFLQDVPLAPADYFHQLATALTWEDFAILALKSSLYGVVIALVTSFQGLAQPLELAQVSNVTTRALVASFVACVLLDAVFILVYLIM